MWALVSLCEPANRALGVKIKPRIKLQNGATIKCKHPIFIYVKWLLNKLY